MHAIRTKACLGVEKRTASRRSFLIFRKERRRSLLLRLQIDSLAELRLHHFNVTNDGVAQVGFHVVFASTHLAAIDFGLKTFMDASEK